MKRSSILFTIGSSILVLGLLLSVFIPQAIALDAAQRRLSVNSKEIVTLEHFSEKDERLTGVYIISIVGYKPDDSISLKLLDPAGIAIKHEKMTSEFLMNTFQPLKEGDYVLQIENTTERTMEISARLGHSALGPASVILSMALPSTAILIGVGLLIVGAISYFREKKH